MTDPRAIVREAGGPELLERLDHLDARRSAPARQVAAPPAPDRVATVDADVVVAGGGLSLLLAPALAARGLSVIVADRGTIGLAHREWNASGPELRALETLLSPEEIDRLVVARYRRGICRWHGGGSYPVLGVLDHAVDAGALLARVRALCTERGVTLLDRHELSAHAAGPGGIALRLGSREVVARVLVDARGAASPSATADLVCPTVGGVLGGLAEGEAPDEIDPGTGEILATVDGVEHGVQHVWEAFPGRRGETTVYLFAYARAEDVRPGALAALYARFLAKRPGYKRGDARLLRPTFGYIPGWSRLAPAPRPPSPRVVLVGDAAARHSPLTFCGFGAMLRSFDPAAAAIAGAIADGDVRPARLAGVVEDAPVHAGTGALARLMARPSRDPRRSAELNALLDAAFATLHELGNEPYAALLQDRMELAAFVDFLRRTARRRPAVYGEVLSRLGLLDAGRWALGLARGLSRRSSGAANRPYGSPGVPR